MFSVIHRHAIFDWGIDTNDEVITLTVHSQSLPWSLQWQFGLFTAWSADWLQHSQVFTVVELIPALLTEPSGLQTSTNQPLVSTQFVVFSSWPAFNKLKLPFRLSPQSPSAGKKNSWTECTWFFSNVLHLHLWISKFSSLYCIIPCKEVNAVCFLTGLIRYPE